MVKLWQNIDTLKLHIYSTTLVDVLEIKKYNEILEKMITVKKEAQQDSNDNRSFSHHQVSFGSDDFQVMPSTVRGFSVSIKNQEVTIHFKRLLLSNSLNPFIKIEFRSSFLHRYGYLNAIQKIMTFMKSYIMQNFTTKISEIHLHVDVQGYNFSVLDFHRFKTRSRSHRLYDDGHKESYFYQGRSFQGFMMGSGNYMLRVYNKTKEIKKFPNKSFIEELWSTNNNYNDMEDVYRIEFQLRREKLKTMVIDGEVLDGFEVILNNLNNIWLQCLNDFYLTDLDDNHCLEVIQGYKQLKNGKKILLTTNTIRQRIKRANKSPVWLLIETFNGHYQTDITETFVKPFTNDFIYVHNAFKAYMSTLYSHYQTLRPEIIIDSLNKIDDYTKKKHKKTILQDVMSRRLDRFNKLEIVDKTFEKMTTQKEYFLEMCHEVFENSFNEIYDEGVNLSFYEKLQKVM